MTTKFTEKNAALVAALLKNELTDNARREYEQKLKGIFSHETMVAANSILNPVLPTGMNLDPGESTPSEAMSSPEKKETADKRADTGSAQSNATLLLRSSAEVVSLADSPLKPPEKANSKTEAEKKNVAEKDVARDGTIIFNDEDETTVVHVGGRNYRPPKPTPAPTPAPQGWLGYVWGGLSSLNPWGAPASTVQSGGQPAPTKPKTN